MRRTSIIGSAVVTASLVLGSAGAVVARTTPDADPPPTTRAAPATSTTVGVTSTDTSSGTCSSGATVVQLTSGVGSYEVPQRGVATSVSYNANATPGQIRAAFFVPGVAANHWTVVAKSDLLTIAPNVLNTVPVRIPVESGWRLGLYVSTTTMNCNQSTGSFADTERAAFFDPGTSSDFGPGQFVQSHRANVAVVVESDADRDGYGDVTQDSCPASAATQAACPAPQTRITKAPGRRTTDRTPTIRFTSVAGATFRCKIDRRQVKPCASPFTKRYRYGKHTVVIRAISPVGIKDPTPAKVRFTVKRRG